MRTFPMYRTMYNLVDISAYSLPVAASVNMLVVLYNNEPVGNTRSVSFSVLAIFHHMVSDLNFQPSCSPFFLRYNFFCNKGMSSTFTPYACSFLATYVAVRIENIQKRVQVRKHHSTVRGRDQSVSVTLWGWYPGVFDRDPARFACVCSPGFM